MTTVLPEQAGAGKRPPKAIRLLLWLGIPFGVFVLWQLSSAVFIGCALVQMDDSGKVRALKAEILRIGAPLGATGALQTSSSQNGLGATPFVTWGYRVPGDPATVQATWQATITAAGYAPVKLSTFPDQGSFYALFKRGDLTADLHCDTDAGVPGMLLCDLTLN